MFELIEVFEQIYKGVTPSKTPTTAEANIDGHIRGKNGGEAALPTNPEKGRDGKRKKKIQAIQAIRPPKQNRHYCCMAPETPQRSVKY